MKILIIHPSFPGQFLNLALRLGENPENEVLFLSKVNTIDASIKGVRLALYKGPHEVAKETHPYLVTATEAVLEGQQTVRVLEQLRNREGYVPDIVIGHTGWGNLLFIKDVYPEVPVLGYFEWYYHAKHSDSCWWPDEKLPMNSVLAVRMKNTHHLLSLEACDAGYTPTQWQYDQFPEEFRYKLTIQHDGIDTEFCRPSAKPVGLKLEDVGIDFAAGTEIVTYVSRGFEVFRGFPYFMDAMRLLLKKRPKLHVIVVGADRVCYGAQLHGTSYLKEEKKKGGFDEKRLHFVGVRNRGDYRKILQASSCHVYLTRPFVLSWSMLEAMSFGCPLVASKTPPVEEVVTDGVNGLLAEFRSPRHIARRVEEVLDDRALAARLGLKARQTILERYELQRSLSRIEDLMYRLLP